MSTEKQIPEISVIIPCYNEEKNLEQGVLDEVYDYLVGQTFTWEVLIVNDESTDNSRALIERIIENKEHFSLFDIAHGGKPAAVWGGHPASQGRGGPLYRHGPIHPDPRA